MTETITPKHVAANVNRTGEYWVVVPDTATNVVVLNETGHTVFELCDGTRSPLDIARTIADSTGADFAKVSDDVDAFIAQLEKSGLLARV